MLWHVSNRADAEVVPLADRHYNRQKIGAPQFAPPGRAFVLKTQPLDAYWITSWPFAQYVRHAWAGAWVCSAFRNEGAHLSSELIRQAVAATRWEWPEVPALGMITFVDAGKTKRRRSKHGQPGACFLHAGFRFVGYTIEEGLTALQLLPEDMPEAAPPIGKQLRLWAA